MTGALACAPAAGAAQRVELTLTVDDGNGRAATAHLSCARKARASGYLARRARPACRSARKLVRLLAQRKRPKGKRCVRVDGGPDRAFVFGRIGRRRIDRRFHRRDTCAVSDWERASALFAGAPRSGGREVPSAPPAPAPPPPPGGGDAVVIAVVDWGLAAYHFDFRASRMPQHTNSDATDDLPLDRPPHEWLAGFPDPAGFEKYEPLRLTLTDDPDARIEDLIAADSAEWEKVQASDALEPSYYWMPGTKVIGALTFAPSPIVSEASSHGTGVASVAVGNLHGACPECLLVFVDMSAGEEATHDWALRQPWIDAVTNSWGYGTTGVMRDQVYSGSDVALQSQASERGQTIFFSAGNGLNNDFVVPTTTLFSSQKGPDWMVTVGAVRASDGDSWLGAGKQVDLAGVGNSYPSAYGSATVSGSGKFGGTSNAAPTIAGTYGSALYRVRRALAGPSRIQSDGVVARGPAACGTVRPACELADGELTAVELRRRLMFGAKRGAGGLAYSAARTPPTEEEELLAEGHGTYLARLKGADHMAMEQERIVGPLFGGSAELERPAGEAEWFVVDSWCRQHLWGDWDGGNYRDGDPLPEPDPAWPTRTALVESCSLLPSQEG